MTDEARKLRDTARQVLEGELLFSDPFLPAGRNPLPGPPGGQRCCRAFED